MRKLRLNDGGACKLLRRSSGEIDLQLKLTLGRIYQIPKELRNFFKLSKCWRYCLQMEIIINIYRIYIKYIFTYIITYILEFRYKLSTYN